MTKIEKLEEIEKDYLHWYEVIDRNRLNNIPDEVFNTRGWNKIKPLLEKFVINDPKTKFGIENGLFICINRHKSILVPVTNGAELRTEYIHLPYGTITRVIFKINGVDYIVNEFNEYRSKETNGWFNGIQSLFNEYILGQIDNKNKIIDFLEEK